MLQSKDCFSFSASRGSARHFFILLFLVTKRAARFRRVALKKLLSVFAEQLSCLPWHIYIIPHSFAKINTILSNFVQIRPHLSKFVQPALKSTAPASKFPSHQEAIRFVQRSFSCCSLRYNLIQILWFSKLHSSANQSSAWFSSSTDRLQVHYTRLNEQCQRSSE